MDDFIENLTGALAPLFQYLEHEVIVDVARRIKETMHYTATAELMAKAMKELGFSPNRIRAEAMKTLNADKKYRKEVAKNTLGFKKKVRKLLDGIRRKAMKEGDELFTGAADAMYNADLSTWRSDGKEITKSSYLPELVDSIQQQTRGELENITRTTGFQGMSGYESIENLYRRELDKAVIKIMSGAFTQEQVVAEVVHDLARSGLRSIDFASGRSMQLDTAVRLALRTSAHQLQAKINDENILKSGQNLVYVSKHWGARNKGTGVANHESWQGKVYYIKPGRDYSKEAKRIGQAKIDDLWEATGYSIDGAHENNPLGLNGYNCRHMVRVWYEGASSLPDEAPVPGPATYNGREYDYYAQTQKMRRMEREVRALRREKEALEVLGYDTDEIDARIKRKRREYSEFCEACHQKEQPERMRYECRTSNLKKTKAWKEYEHYKNIEGYKNFAIINTSNKARAIDLISQDVDEADAIYTRQELIEEIKSSVIGEHIISCIENSDVFIRLINGSQNFSYRGEQRGNVIKIYLSNIPNLRVGAQTIIHEVSHYYYNIGGCQHAEAVCFAMEKMHLLNRDYLTEDEWNKIVKLAVDNYPEYEWEAGGYGEYEQFNFVRKKVE